MAGGRGVAAVPAPVGAACAGVGGGQEAQGEGQGEGLQDEACEEDCLAWVGLGGEEETPWSGAAGA